MKPTMIPMVHCLSKVAFILKKREGLEQVRVRSHHGVVVRTTFTTLTTLLLELAGTRRTKKSKQKQKKLPLVA